MSLFFLPYHLPFSLSLRWARASAPFSLLQTEHELGTPSSCAVARRTASSSTTLCLRSSLPTKLSAPALLTFIPSSAPLDGGTPPRHPPPPSGSTSARWPPRMTWWAPPRRPPPPPPGSTSARQRRAATAARRGGQRGKQLGRRAGAGTGHARGRG